MSEELNEIELNEIEEKNDKVKKDKPMKKQSIKTNYLFNSAYQIFALIVPLITTPYISRVLKAEGIGIYSYTYSIVMYFTYIAALGTSTYAIRKLGIYRENKKQLTIKFWEIFALRLTTSSVCIALYLLYVFLAAENKTIATLQVLNIICIAVDISWFFQGMENFSKIAIRNFIVKIINVCFIFLVVKEQSDLGWYVFSISAWTILANLVMWPSVTKYIGKCKLKELHPYRDLSTIIQLFIPTIAVQIYAILDKSMIGWITHTAAENGYYEQSEKIVKMCLILVTTLGTVTIPKISRENENKNYDEVRRLIYRSYRFVWLMGSAMMFGLMGISSKLVPVFFGPGYEKAEILLPILSLLFILMGLNNATGVQFLISTGRQKIYMYIVIVGGIVNISINAIMIPRLASVGAALGTVTGEIVILLIEMVYIKQKKYYEVKKAFSCSIHYLIAGGLMLAGLLLVNTVMPTNVLGLAGDIILGGCIYGVVLLILRDEFVLTMVTGTLGKFVKKFKKEAK